MAEVWKPDQEIIGENIRKARKAAKLTQEELAEEMGGSCSNKVISRYEKGEVEIVSSRDKPTEPKQKHLSARQKRTGRWQSPMRKQKPRRLPLPQKHRPRQYDSHV